MFIGRTQEKKKLLNLYNSKKAEMVVVYGRRRVGKTTLIDETFGDLITFRHAGQSRRQLDNPNDKRRKMDIQLSTFYLSLKMYGLQKREKPKTWEEAFYLLISLLKEKRNGKKMVVFIDELPWLDTPKSNFISAFEWFWNSWGSSQNDLMVIVSGSSSSWISNNLINNHGGLYDRVTAKIRLKPLNLYESEQLIKSNGVAISRYDITQAYMILGGIPYYLNYIQSGVSLEKSIDDMFFKDEATLDDEFDNLFSSSFEQYELCKKIVKCLNERRAGYTPKEILEKFKISDGASFRKALRSLEKSDFVIKYAPYGDNKNEKKYKLIDSYCLFYLKFVENKKSLDKEFWQDNIESGSIRTWRGLSFENTCFAHLSQIEHKLGIKGIESMQFSYNVIDNLNEETQIDLLILRKDRIMDLCEMKFVSGDFSVDKNYFEKLKNREAIMYKKIPAKYIVHHILITTEGLKYNSYSSIFADVITLNDLFKDE